MLIMLKPLFIVIVYCTMVYGRTYNDTKTLIKDLLQDYDKDIRPVANQSDPVNVEVQLYLKSIQEFNEVKGMFSFVGAPFIVWTDVSLQWDPADYNGTWEVIMPYTSIWIPELILSSPSETIDSIGDKWNRIRIHSNGLCMWLPIALFKSTCSVNVQNFPFDTQSCVASFNNIQYQEYELVIIAKEPKIDTSIYQDNALWDLSDTSAVVGETGNGFQLDFTFHLQRKPTFLVISLMLPILFLSLLNVLVFLLVPESGERASYSITVFLSIAVFMTIVSETLPSISKPVPYISYKLMLDMFISAVIIFVMVLNLRVYSRDEKDPVPGWLQSFYMAMTCQWYWRRKIENAEPLSQPYVPKAKDDIAKIDNNGTLLNTKNDGNNSRPGTANGKNGHAVDQKLAPSAQEELEGKGITWKKISYMFDWIALVFFTLASLTSFVTFIAMTKNGDM